MRRREFIMLIGGAAAYPLAARAQQPAMPVIGFLSSRSPNESSGVVAAFHEGLQETGFSEGRNVTIAFRWAEGRYDRLPGLASELVDLKVGVLFAAGGPPSALAAKAATSTIPVVFSAVNDPEHIGLIVNLNRPGGNVTGMSMLTSGIAAKSVELLKELVPSATLAWPIRSDWGHAPSPGLPSQSDLSQRDGERWNSRYAFVAALGAGA